ncbi:hypothetical protein NM897_17060 (plasmid) [Planococcus maritimus]|uniref:hypothetical protein n=1 Tax=Planococcus maritimus TaxID=192421 RepID=UPI0031394C83
MVNNLFKKILYFSLAIAIGSSYWISQVALGASGEGHTTWYDSVDSGEIRYGGTTKYTTERSHANSLWNAMGLVYIAPDTAFTIQDLTYSDVYSTEDFSGRYNYYAGSVDTIKFNDRIFQARSSSYKKKTAAHELGHALGLDDHYSSSYSGIIMYGYSSGVTSLQSHDKADYNSKW